MLGLVAGYVAGKIVSDPAAQARLGDSITESLEPVAELAYRFSKEGREERQQAREEETTKNIAAGIHGLIDDRMKIDGNIEIYRHQDRDDIQVQLKLGDDDYSRADQKAIENSVVHVLEEAGIAVDRESWPGMLQLSMDQAGGERGIGKKTEKARSRFAKSGEEPQVFAARTDAEKAALNEDYGQAADAIRTYVHDYIPQPDRGGDTSKEVRIGGNAHSGVFFHTNDWRSVGGELTTVMEAAGLKPNPNNLGIYLDQVGGVEGVLAGIEKGRNELGEPGKATIKEPAARAETSTPMDRAKGQVDAMLRGESSGKDAPSAKPSADRAPPTPSAPKSTQVGGRA